MDQVNHETGEIVAREDTPAPRTNTEIATQPPTLQTMMQDDSIERMMKLADVMATGKVTVPEHVRNPGDCLAIIMQSAQWGMNPFAVAQKTFMVQGKLGYEAQLVNAAITTMSPTKDRLHFEWFGPWEDYAKHEDTCGVKVWATLKGEAEPRYKEVTMAQAKIRNSPLWKEDPQQQLAYLATRRWARLYCPDVILGVYTPDEADEIDITPTPTREVVQPKAKTADQKTDERKEVEKSLRACGSLGALQAAWEKLTPKQHKDFQSVKDEMKATIDEAEKAAAQAA